MGTDQKIECRICQKAKSEFDRINQRINQAGTIAEKTSHARELLQKIEAVRKEHENVDKGLAEVCRTVLNLRKQTAEVILKFEK
jgi:predicted transcriptional regulator